MFKNNYLLTLVALISITALGACEQDVNPVVGEDRPFTLWGYMNAGADTQFVQVFEISDQLGNDRSGPIDATVVSTDLTSGDQWTWRDSVVTFADGNKTHVFYAPFRAPFDHKFRLDVTRSDGANSTVEVQVPPFVSVKLNKNLQDSKIPVEINGKAPLFVQLQVVYNAATLPPANAWPQGSPKIDPVQFPVPVSYLGKEEPTATGWTVEIDMKEDFPIVEQEYELNCLADGNRGITLRTMKFNVLVAEKDWAPPGGVFDANVLAQPGTFSNIENGFGFFGAGFGVSESWFPPINVVEGVGFSFNTPCPMFAADIPACQVPPDPCFRDMN